MNHIQFFEILASDLRKLEFAKMFSERLGVILSRKKDLPARFGPGNMMRSDTRKQAAKIKNETAEHKIKEIKKIYDEFGYKDLHKK